MRPGRGIFCPFRVNPRIFFHLLSYPLPNRVFFLLSDPLSPTVHLRSSQPRPICPSVRLSFIYYFFTRAASISIYSTCYFFFSLRNAACLPRLKMYAFLLFSFTIYDYSWCSAAYTSTKQIIRHASSCLLVSVKKATVQSKWSWEIWYRISHTRG